MLKACEAKPKDRYKDISELLGELFGQTIERAGADKPVTAEKGSGRVRAPKSGTTGDCTWTLDGESNISIRDVTEMQLRLAKF